MTDPINAVLDDTTLATLNGGEETVVLKPDIDILDAIISTVQVIVAEDPTSPFADTLYLTIKSFLKSILPQSDTQSYLDSLFAYYLEGYRAYHIIVVKGDKDDPTWYNKAALSIFDLYLSRPDEYHTRWMLVKSTQSLQEVITTIHMNDSDKPIGDLISDLSNVALLSKTTGSYIKGIRRRKNYGYIKWLKTFFARALTLPNFEFLRTDPLVGKVITQVMTTKMVIEIPSH